MSEGSSIQGAGPVMAAEHVVALYTLLLEHRVQLWLDGGWGVDALLQQQTRPHKDLDALAQLDDLAALSTVLAACGFHLKMIWEENRWAPYASVLPLIGRATPSGSEVATAFVLQNQRGDELDVHVVQFDARGAGIAQWDTGFIYPSEAFAGCGRIGATPVRCLSAQTQMNIHTGYALQAKDLQDLRHLHDRFGIAYLDEQARYFAG